MKNKKFICLIALLCIIVCTLSIILSGCNLLSKKNNSNSNISSSEMKKYLRPDGYLDLENLPESELAGNEVSLEEWKEALKTSSFYNVTAYFNERDTSLMELDKALGCYTYDVNAMKFELKYLESYKDPIYNGEGKHVHAVENNHLYIYFEWNNSGVGDGWFREDCGEIENFTTIAFLDDIKSCYSFLGDILVFSMIAEKFEDFTFEDGYFLTEKILVDDNYDKYIYNVKLSFKNGKLRTFAFQDSLSSERCIFNFVFADYGKTKVSIPKNFTEYEEYDD